MNRFISLFIIFILVVSLVSCVSTTVIPEQSVEQDVKATITPEIITSPTPTVKPKTTEDLEIERAIEYGFVPDKIQGNYGAEISFDQYISMVTNLITVWDESKLEEWNRIVALAKGKTDYMRREDGILILSLADVMMGANKFNFQYDEKYEYSDEDLQTQLNSLSWNYPYFPDLNLDEIAYEYCISNVVWGGVQFFEEKASHVSYKLIFPFVINLQEPLTRKDAILSVVRLAESDAAILEPQGEYISLNEVDTFDKTIITDTLLNQKSNLPVPTQAQLPDSWKGSGISGRKEGNFPYKDYKESDIKFLADNGMNFSRVFFSFSTLQFPDYPTDKSLVNIQELKDLDQLIAWGIKYGVHIQISSTDPFAPETNLSKVSDADWKLYADYWAMLAKRYAEIPSTYLSFDLINELQPQKGNIAGAVAGIKLVRDSILANDSDRVLVYSFIGNSLIDGNEWEEAIASLGIALGIHPYYPSLLLTIEDKQYNQNPLIGDPEWPMVWFPGGQISEGKAPLVIKGEISGGQLQLSCFTYNNGGSVEVFADGEFLESIKPTDGTWNGNNYDCAGGIAGTVDIPEGTNEIMLKNKLGNRIDSVLFKGKDNEIHMNTIDSWDYLDMSDPLPLIIKSDGTYTNSENKVVDAETVYDLKIKPMVEIAEKNHVGYMVNEFGSFAVQIPYKNDTINRYTDDMMTMLEAHNIGWNFCETQGWPYRFITAPIEQFQWDGAELSEVTYDFSNGITESFFVNTSMLDVFRKHTLK